MKIIGKTNDGYLLDATGHEVALCAGANRYGYFRDGEDPSGYDRRLGWTIGTTIKVTAAITYLDELRAREKDVRAGAVALGALAAFIERGLPTTIVPPEMEKPEGAK